MMRMKSIAAGLVSAAVGCLLAGIVPAAQAQTSCQISGGPACSVHFVGAGASAQLIMSGIAADQAAISANDTLYGGGNTIKHWSKKFKSSTNDGAYLSDNRNSLIVEQTGNVWVVWIENGAGFVTDIWTYVSVDASVGVRCVLAQQTNGSGCQVQITSAAGTTTDSLIATNLWPDGKADAVIDLAAIQAINTSIGGGQHVNVGLSDARAEDVLAATNRAKCALTLSLSCLGYTTANKNVGSEILTAQGTNSFAQPVGFALPGEKDPFTSRVVPTTFTNLAIGAAPIVFITNNGNTNGPSIVTNLITGVTPDLHATGQTYPLAHLFDGTTECSTGNAAFGGSGSGGTALTLFVREPPSGSANTVEFNLFRTDGNTTDSQEANVTTNPLNQSCANNVGSRQRAIGTTEVIGSSSPAYGLLGVPNSLGYIFTGWGNLGKFKGSRQFNYLTLDGVDPLFAAPTAYSECINAGTPTGQICGPTEACSVGTCTPGGNTAQTVPFCSTSTCSSDLWPTYSDTWTGYSFPAGASYPNLRYGLYTAWSAYRWITAPNGDPYGPSALSQEAQNYTDHDVADFVPFAACAPGTGSSCLTTTGATDGLAVLRSHFMPSGVKETACTSTTVSNGSVTSANQLDGGNTLGGGSECGGDLGGLIFGPFGTSSPSVSYVAWTATLTKGKGYKLTYKNGDKFTSTEPSTGSNVTLTCDDANGTQHIVDTTVELNSAGTVYVGEANPDKTLTIACKLVDGNIAHGLASVTQDGTTYHGKHQ